MNVPSIADELFRELSEPEDVSIPSIAFWLNSNIGKLNNLLGTEYISQDSNIVPELDEQTKSIYKLLYLISYSIRQINKNLGAAGYTSFAEVKEGNRSVRRVNKTDIAKTYQSLVNSYNDELQGQLLNYKMNHSTPQQFIVDNPILTELPTIIASRNSFSRRGDDF